MSKRKSNEITEISTPNDNTNKSTTNAINEHTAPSYGSHEYWERRYTKHTKLPTPSSDNNQITAGFNENDRDELDDVSNQNDDLGSAQHEWYFTYEELKPLLLPLVLGRSSDDDECNDWSSNNEDVMDGEDDEEWIEVEEEYDEEEGNDSNGCNVNQPRNEDDENDSKGTETKTMNDMGTFCQPCIDTEAGNSHENDTIYTCNIDKLTPKSILEIGCGDVPIVYDLYKDLKNNIKSIMISTIHNGDTKMTNNNDTNKIENNDYMKLIVNRVIAFDYSETVIQHLLKQHNTADDLVQYKTHDARNLPYHSQEFHLIIDKGTLDAMISDSEVGIQNCVEIMSEASRLLAYGGYIVIISHMNANTNDGLNWLDEVIITGLETGDKDSFWRIEIHGTEIDSLDDDSNEGDDDDEKSIQSDSSNHLTPAVYIIRKFNKDLFKDRLNKKKVDIKFFGY